MTINQIANKIIKDIIAWPEEARQSQSNSGPKTSWDEYKEQVQYEEYDSYEIFKSTIEEMIDDEVISLSVKDFETLAKSCCNIYYFPPYEEKKKAIIKAIWREIDDRAYSDDILYRKPVIRFIRYKDCDLTIVGQVLKQVSPEEFLVHSYSEATGPDGEQGLANLDTLDCENELERITKSEFKKEKFRLTTLIESNEQTEYFDVLHEETKEDVKKRHSSGSMLHDIPVEKVEQNAIPENPIKGLNQEFLIAGITVAGFHIEAGAKRFIDYVNIMIKDLGEKSKPYLKMFYNAVRDYPGFDAEGMDDYEAVSQADVEKILQPKKDLESSQPMSQLNTERSRQALLLTIALRAKAKNISQI